MFTWLTKEMENVSLALPTEDCLLAWAPTTSCKHHKR